MEKFEISPQQILLSCGKAFGTFLVSFFAYFILGNFLNLVILVLWYIFKAEEMSIASNIIFWASSLFISLFVHFFIALKSAIIRGYKALYELVFKVWIIPPFVDYMVSVLWAEPLDELQLENTIKEEVVDFETQVVLWLHNKVKLLSPFWQRVVNYLLGLTPMGHFISFLKVSSKEEMKVAVTKLVDNFFEMLAHNAVPPIFRYISWIYYAGLLFFVLLA